MNDEEFFVERLKIYDLLRRLFVSPPSQEVLNTLNNLSSENDDMYVALSLLKKVSISNLTKLEAEFTRLFIGPGKILAPPYESYYVSGKKLLMQEAAVAVRRKYLKAGVSMQKLYSIPDDHLVSELEFMFYLCDKCYEEFLKNREEKIENYLKMQKEFLEQHLIKWIPIFCENIINSTEHDFFKGLALFTRAYIKEDMNVLALIKVC